MPKPGGGVSSNMGLPKTDRKESTSGFGIGFYFVGATVVEPVSVMHSSDFDFKSRAVRPGEKQMPPVSPPPPAHMSAASDPDGR